MYNKMWHQTQEALNSLLNKESQKMMETQTNQSFIFQTLATFYIKYVQIFRNMENVYDQIVHPQKRILIRKILDGVMGRILELKNEMVELELSEFHYFDDILQDLKLAPRYSVKGIPFDDAIKFIQIAERARQGRLRAIFMKQIYLREYRAKQAKTEKVVDTGAAALCIQKDPPPLFNEVSATIIQAEKVNHLRSEVQIRHEEDYREAMVTIKDDLKLIEGADIRETLQDQIRHWFIECR
ncbi:IQ and AAA domain-containing protein 1 [Tupaia chinensis]|uniref:IQ and AAA domain-containing protein 1 n=1 Tax=Tupaia chinensis TaxID=246437 RepID=L9LC66_TUPCH|nr:IQ and AAA domain-containing protein 1 [Tupaia chinensis]